MPNKKKVKDKRETRGNSKAGDNKHLYGRSARPLSVTGSLPTWADVDLAVEAKLAVSGVTERVAVNAVASDLREVWAETTIIKVSCSAIQSNGLGSAEVDLFEQGVFLSSEVLYDIEAYVKNSGNPVFIL